MMPPRKRRPARHRLDPLRYLTPELLVQVRNILALCVAAAAPSAVISQQNAHKVEATGEQLTYANANTNAALGIVTELSARLERAEAKADSALALARESLLRERRTAARLPEAMIGPSVPLTWTLKPPPKHPRWQFWRT